MKGMCIALALAATAFVNAAAADDYSAWPKSAPAKCLMDRGDSKVAAFAAVDANCGPVGDASRAGRAFVLGDEFEDLIRSIKLGDAAGTKQMMTGFYRTTNRSPALNSCWKTMVQKCGAESIGATIEAAKPN
ncbi:hypothetical protein [Dongia sp.]|uniref:hypothetical protein n=1 Tax=Dongia sp. TaxID=1977262 RepID=UPI0037535316